MGAAFLVCFLKWKSNLTELKGSILSMRWRQRLGVWQGGSEGCAEAEVEWWVGAGRGVMSPVRENCLFSLPLTRKQEALLWL